MQISPNGKYEIYSFCQSGTFAFNNDICGTIVLEKGKPFSENKGYKINGDIKSWKDDTLLINRFDHSLDQPKDTITRISFEKFKDLNLKIYNYGAINSGGMKEYSFEYFNLDEREICLKILGESWEKILAKINVMH
ncbi:hypothetical protein [Chryseobacterium sp. 3008163]|uniref:hypothetical protein n=1 Tax=Chryseobacterium sp. 3008163 TaxID=2478663 RepID=UPI001013C527|nr:hypothetical protein [Chryseobacterium sp. 3008163]